ncbi:MAG: SGNH/GDSL hydrolase family protein [Anaerolineales bacterium]|nr:SGNH/GDSL hydrolase family protein [Anaerolineales bacterium]
MEQLRFLALGDSYTIGESVPVDQRWPVQLADRLRDAGLMVEEPVIVARTGWTTTELQAGMTQAGLQGSYDLVSLLIVVNNQYRGYPTTAYRQEFRQLLAQAIQFAGGDPKRVIVLSIPDWGVTPFARGRDPVQIAGEIDTFNAINREETQAAGAAYIDVTPISRQAVNQPSLIAGDGLHPSGEMYAAWVELVLPSVLAILQ